MESLLDLSAPRTVVLEDRRRTFTLHCRRILKADWLAYFAAIRVTSEQTNEGVVNTHDYNTAARVLVERVLVGAEGYKVAGGAELVSIPGWQSRLPVAHRFDLAGVLCGVGRSAPSAEDEFLVVHPEAEEIAIDAFWGVGADGGMQQFKGLKHVMRTPSFQQDKRYNDAASRSIVVGGRTGKTVYTGAHPVLMDLYDELVVSVEGYAGLSDDPKRIAAEMDGYHKFVAAKEVFNPSAPALAPLEHHPEDSGLV